MPDTHGVQARLVGTPQQDTATRIGARGKLGLFDSADYIVFYIQQVPPDPANSVCVEAQSGHAPSDGRCLLSHGARWSLGIRGVKAGLGETLVLRRVRQFVRSRESASEHVPSVSEVGEPVVTTRQHLS